MKKTFFKVIIIIAALAVIYIVFNQFDVNLGPREYTLKDLRGNPSFGVHNAFFHLWALTEPPDVDIEGEKTIAKFRKLYHSQSDYQKYRAEWDAKSNKAYRNMYREHWMDKIVSMKTINVPIGSLNDLSENCLKHKEKIIEFQQKAEVLMTRYRRMLDCEVFEDFTAADTSAPIPNLLHWLNIARQYNRFYILHALNGNWQEGTAKLLHHLQFTVKANKGSLPLITNLVAKAILRHTLNALNSLMNRKECPKEVNEQVLNNLPELEYKEYGSWPLLGEYLLYNYYNWRIVREMENVTFLEKTLLPLFTQKNRTVKYKDEFMLKVIERDKTPPYKWGTGPLKIEKAVKGWFWWLQNPGGKILFDKYIRDSIINLNNVIYKTHLTKTLYDMLRISAELHLNYTPDKPVQEILTGLQTYRTLLDPCSNTPYKWNEDKQLLYSIGADRKDDDGMYDYDKLDDCDYVLPCILYLK
jgi:hypothetical protein